MNDHSETTASTCDRKGVSLLDAARALGVSEKTLRRKIHAGEVEGEKVSLDGGGLAWRVYLADGATVPEVVPEGSEARAGTSNDRAGSVPDTQTTVPEPDITVPIAQRTNAPEVTEARAGTVPEVEPDTLRLAEMREEIQFLRGLVEQHQRSEAELRAALRTALSALPKGLPAGDETSPPQVLADSQNSSHVRVQAPQTSAATVSTSGTSEAQQTANTAQKFTRPARPFWKILLGLK